MEYFKGVDVFGRQNYSEAFKKENIESGLSQRLTITHYFDQGHHIYDSIRSDGWSIALFYEMIGNKNSSAGISLGYNLGTYYRTKR